MDDTSSQGRGQFVCQGKETNAGSFDDKMVVKERASEELSVKWLGCTEEYELRIGGVIC